MEPALAVAKSGLPSPLKSPVATDTGSVPTRGLEVFGQQNPPAPSPRRTAALSERLLATSTSFFAFPLMSAATTDSGLLMPSRTEKATLKLPVPSPRRTDRLPSSLRGSPSRLATTRSAMPSESKSPTTTDVGASPTATSGAAVKLPLPSPKKIETLSASETTTARSALASLLKSPTATATGYARYTLLVTGRSGAEVNLPVPSPRRIETVSERLLATARSGRPSPLKSPTATARGLNPHRCVDLDERRRGLRRGRAGAQRAGHGHDHDADCATDYTRCNHSQPPCSVFVKAERSRRCQSRGTAMPSRMEHTAGTNACHPCQHG